ncbi:MAG: ABC transporter ATP-binding protein [Deltaproteobacteria bacterium]|nr:ABC transporter ATP-binding protein [Deltaproteobacteria bacterium]
MIQVSDLAKYFDGRRALGPVSFDIAAGETVGFLGLNGAGKTTVLRILACDLRPSGGSLVIGGVDAVENPHEVRKQVGFVPENPPVYSDMTVGDYLRFAGRLRGMSAQDVEKRLPEVSATTHLEDAHDELCRNLSHGFRQRVGVAQAIMHRPKLLIFDEPTRGLDPVQIVEVRAMIRNLKQAHTVLISSHILPEISETCDRLLVLGEGTIVASGTESQLSTDLASARRSIVGVRTDRGTDDVVRCIRDVSSVTEVGLAGEEDGALLFQVVMSKDARAEVCRALVTAGHDVVKLDRAQHKLESIFLKLVKGGDVARH